MKRKVREKIVGFSMTGPAILFILLLLLYPLLYSGYLSLTNYYFLDPTGTQFVGLRNYLQLLGNDGFKAALLNSVLFGVIYIPTVTCLSLIIALALYQISSWWTKLFRSLMFLPVGIGLTLVSLMWIWLLRQDGLVNYLLQNWLHLPKVGWLASNVSTVISVVIMTIWKFLGFNVIFFLAGLNSISLNIFEAATIDGVNSFQRLRYIAIPMVKDVMAIVIINSTIASVKVYEQIWAISRGGGIIDVLYTYMYKTSFRYFEMGQGAAISFFMGLLVLALSFFTLKRVKNE